MTPMLAAFLPHVLPMRLYPLGRLVGGVLDTLMPLLHLEETETSKSATRAHARQQQSPLAQAGAAAAARAAGEDAVWSLASELVKLGEYRLCQIHWRAPNSPLASPFPSPSPSPWGLHPHDSPCDQAPFGWGSVVGWWPLLFSEIEGSLHDRLTWMRKACFWHGFHIPVCHAPSAQTQCWS